MQKVVVIFFFSVILSFSCQCFLSNKNVFLFSHKCQFYVHSYCTSKVILIYKAAVSRIVTLLSHVLTHPFLQGSMQLQHNWKTFKLKNMALFPITAVIASHKSVTKARITALQISTLHLFSFRFILCCLEKTLYFCTENKTLHTHSQDLPLIVGEMGALMYVGAINNI